MSKKIPSEDRNIRKHLLTRAKKGRLRKGETEQFYVDNLGIEYPYKWEAKLSSFYNIFMGCLRNGFPIVVPRLWYAAWAFYPFFFVHRHLRADDPVSILNHERIHVRQQYDIHLTISLPLIIFCGIAEHMGWFNPLPILCGIPFMPTIIYGLEMLRSFVNLLEDNKFSDITFHRVRENTCFEREAISRATNADYLLTRKFWAVFAYTGWKRFMNYGIK